VPFFAQKTSLYLSQQLCFWLPGCEISPKTSTQLERLYNILASNLFMSVVLVSHGSKA
jgi:hypothetical protein